MLSQGKWRLLRTVALDGATNMALDVALMERARATGESVFRVYAWKTATLSLGRNQIAAGRYDPARLRDRGLDVVRRPTGGRAILHWREVTYSVTAPTAADSLPASYAGLNAVLLHALSSMGVDALPAVRGKRERNPDTVPCFAEPSAGEIIVRGGSKLVGSAQFRVPGALLQHGSILIEDDQALLHELQPAARPAPRPATLNATLGRPVLPAEVGDALFASVRELLDRNAVFLQQAEMLPHAAAHVPLFRDPRWTWRR